MIVRPVITLAMLAAIAAAQSALPPEVLLLSKVKRQAKHDLERIPNFTCIETIERSSRNAESKPFNTVDTVLIEVAHTGDREMFAWPGGHFETADLGAMIGSGLVSNGEFLGHARSVFIGDLGTVRYHGREQVEGRQAARYDYAVTPSFSGYTIHNAGRQAVIGVRGSFWADAATFDLLRLTADGSDIPAELGVRHVTTVVDYSRVRIGSDYYLLPQSATVALASESGREERNRIEFTHCRQYATESVLTFADPDIEAAKPAGNAAPRIVETFFPADSIVMLSLETPIDLEHDTVGREISARLESDVSHKGRVFAPKGALVSGRIRLLRREGAGYSVGLEFTDVTFDGGHANFLAKLASLDSRYAQAGTSVETSSSPGFQLELPMALAGVATFFIPDPVKVLPKGMRTQWRTVQPRR